MRESCLVQLLFFKCADSREVKLRIYVTQVVIDSVETAEKWEFGGVAVGCGGEEF